MSPNRIDHALAPLEDKGLDTCATCPKLCRWACPVAEAESRESTSPWSLVMLSGFLKRGLAQPETVGEFPYHCTHCGACTEACLHKNDVPLLLSLARARVLEGHAAPAGAVEVRGRFGVGGNPYGTPLAEPLAVMGEQGGLAPEDATRAVPPGSTLYMPGCATLIERPSAGAAFLRALTLKGLSGVVIAEPSASCCGLPLLWAGDLEGFRAHAQRHAERVDAAGALVVHDPACAHAMKVRYPELGIWLRPRVLHVAAFFAERFGLAAPKDAGESIEGSGARMGGQPPVVPPGLDRSGGGEPSSVAYLDCCQLSRGMRLLSAPRNLIARATGALPKELPGLRGMDADCCGAAGLLPMTAPASATAMAEARIQAFKQSGASQLATFSPRCAAHLVRVDPNLPVVDVSELLELPAK